MVAEAEEMKMEKRNSIYKIGVVDDKVVAEKVRQKVQESSALNVGIMLNFPRIVI